MENWKLKEIEKNLMIAQGVPYYWECKDTVFKEEFLVFVANIVKLSLIEKI